MRFAILFPLWLVLALGESVVAHSCPMHGGGGHAAMAAAPESATGHHHGAPPPDSNRKRGCSCIGVCTATAPAPVPRTSAVPTAIVRIGAPAVPARWVRSARFDAHPLLPYANGPPAPRI